jgi:hypothetical protein
LREAQERWSLHFSFLKGSWVYVDLLDFCVHRVNMVSCHECTAVTLPCASFHQLQHTRIHIMIICMKFLHLRQVFFLVSSFCFLLLLAAQGCKLSFYWLLGGLYWCPFSGKFGTELGRFIFVGNFEQSPFSLLPTYRMHGRHFVLGGHTWAGPSLYCLLTECMAAILF